jgi:sigma-B regulation protein RsbU (phosphoserine phosphatase)
VDGDFFRILPEKDRGVLLVVGDVSGKGLKAAMTVSAIMGALRDESPRKLTKVLARLNRGQFGQVNGLVTCLAMLIARNGTVTPANAAHQQPASERYRGNSRAVWPGGRHYSRDRHQRES